MIKQILISTTALGMMLFLLAACADDQQASADASAKATDAAAASPAQAANAKQPSRPAPAQAEQRPQESFQSAAVMSEAVDFSSAEQITASIDKIKQGAGDQAANRVQNAIDYLLVYDLSVGRNKQKLYDKLNGKTPNQILAMINR